MEPAGWRPTCLSLTRLPARSSLTSRPSGAVDAIATEMSDPHEAMRSREPDQSGQSSRSSSGSDNSPVTSPASAGRRGRPAAAARHLTADHPRRSPPFFTTARADERGSRTDLRALVVSPARSVTTGTAGLRVELGEQGTQEVGEAGAVGLVQPPSRSRSRSSRSARAASTVRRPAAVRRTSTPRRSSGSGRRCTRPRVLEAVHPVGHRAAGHLVAVDQAARGTARTARRLDGARRARRTPRSRGRAPRTRRAGPGRDAAPAG